MMPHEYSAAVVLYVACLLVITDAQSPPEIIGLSTIVYGGENEDSPRQLYVYSVNDPDGDSVICTNSITSVDTTAVGQTHTGTEFDFLLATDDLYKLYVDVTAAGDFNPDLVYTNSISCEDSTGMTSTGTTDVIVGVVAGQDLYFNNLPLAVGTYDSFDVTSSPSGTQLKTISASDDLGTVPLQYSIYSVSPSSLTSFFNISLVDGVVTAAQNLLYISKATDSAIINVMVTDGKLEVIAPYSVKFTKQVTVPSVLFVTNLATSLTETKSENELAAGDTVFTLSTNDPDISETYTYRFTCDPTGAKALFNLSSPTSTTLDTMGFEMASGKTLDFETFPSITCSFYASDTVHEGGPFVYTLTVEDDNDTPAFTETNHFVTTTEGDVGSVVGTPAFSCTDQDTGQSHSYMLDDSVTNYDKFSIDASTGEMKFAVKYDTDTGGAGMDSTVVLNVFCIDDGTPNSVVKTATTQVTITIDDVNDEYPILNPKAVSFPVSQTNSIGDTLGTLDVTDLDPGVNGQVTCSGSSGDLYESYFNVNADGTVSLIKTIDFATQNTATQFIVTCVDGGSPQLTGTGTVDIILIETTTTSTTTTTESYNFWDHAENIVLFVLCLLMGLALLGLLLWCCLTKCCGGRMCPRQCCDSREPRPRRRREVSPARSRTPVRRALTPEKPMRMIEERQPVRVVRTFAQPVPPQYGSWTSGAPRPLGGFLRSAPPGAGFY